MARDRDAPTFGPTSPFYALKDIERALRRAPDSAAVREALDLIEVYKCRFRPNLARKERDDAGNDVLQMRDAPG